MDEQTIFIICSIVFAAFGWYSANQVNKTQLVRLVDIFVYGPYLAFLAFNKDYTLGFYDKLFILFLGITTITYNGRNYLSNN
jgi:hypothetical protein